MTDFFRRGVRGHFQNSYSRRGCHSLSFLGFTLLVSLVVEGSLWTRSARACTHKIRQRHNIHLTKSQSHSAKCCSSVNFYSRFSVGSWPLPHSLTQKVQWLSPQMSPARQVHCVSVVGVHFSLRTRAPENL